MPSLLAAAAVAGPSCATQSRVMLRGRGIDVVDGRDEQIRILLLCDNSIRSLEGISGYSGLRVLRLENNKIENISEFTNLKYLTQLTNITLKGCPVTEDPRYRRTLILSAPTIRRIDSCDVTQQDLDSVRNDVLLGSYFTTQLLWINNLIKGMKAEGATRVPPQKWSFPFPVLNDLNLEKVVPNSTNILKAIFEVFPQPSDNNSDEIHLARCSSSEIIKLASAGLFNKSDVNLLEFKVGNFISPRFSREESFSISCTGCPTINTSLLKLLSNAKQGLIAAAEYRSSCLLQDVERKQKTDITKSLLNLIPSEYATVAHGPKHGSEMRQTVMQTPPENESEDGILDSGSYQQQAPVRRKSRSVFESDSHFHNLTSGITQSHPNNERAVELKQFESDWSSRKDDSMRSFKERLQRFEEEDEAKYKSPAEEDKLNPSEGEKRETPTRTLQMKRKPRSQQQCGTRDDAPPSPSFITQGEWLDISVGEKPELQTPKQPAVRTKNIATTTSPSDDDLPLPTAAEILHMASSLGTSGDMTSVSDIITDDSNPKNSFDLFTEAPAKEAREATKLSELTASSTLTSSRPKSRIPTREETAEEKSPHPSSPSRTQSGRQMGNTFDDVSASFPSTPQEATAAVTGVSDVKNTDLESLSSASPRKSSPVQVAETFGRSAPLGRTRSLSPIRQYDGKSSPKTSGEHICRSPSPDVVPVKDTHQQVKSPSPALASVMRGTASSNAKGRSSSREDSASRSRGLRGTSSVKPSATARSPQQRQQREVSKQTARCRSSPSAPSRSVHVRGKGWVSPPRPSRDSSEQQQLTKTALKSPSFSGESPDLTLRRSLIPGAEYSTPLRPPEIVRCTPSMSSVSTETRETPPQKLESIVLKESTSSSAIPCSTTIRVGLAVELIETSNTTQSRRIPESEGAKITSPRRVQLSESLTTTRVTPQREDLTSSTNRIIQIAPKAKLFESSSTRIISRHADPKQKSELVESSNVIRVVRQKEDLNVGLTESTEMFVLPLQSGSQSNILSEHSEMTHKEVLSKKIETELKIKSVSSKDISKKPSGEKKKKKSAAVASSSRKKSDIRDSEAETPKSQSSIPSKTRKKSKEKPKRETQPEYPPEVKSEYIKKEIIEQNEEESSEDTNKSLRISTQTSSPPESEQRRGIRLPREELPTPLSFNELTDLQSPDIRQSQRSATVSDQMTTSQESKSRSKRTPSEEVRGLSSTPSSEGQRQRCSRRPSVVRDDGSGGVTYLRLMNDSQLTRQSHSTVISTPERVSRGRQPPRGLYYSFWRQLEGPNPNIDNAAKCFIEATRRGLLSEGIGAVSYPSELNQILYHEEAALSMVLKVRFEGGTYEPDVEVRVQESYLSMRKSLDDDHAAIHIEAESACARAGIAAKNADDPELTTLRGLQETFKKQFEQQHQQLSKSVSSNSHSRSAISISDSTQLSNSSKKRRTTRKRRNLGDASLFAVVDALTSAGVSGTLDEAYHSERRVRKLFLCRAFSRWKKRWSERVVAGALNSAAKTTPPGAVWKTKRGNLVCQRSP